MTNKKVKLKLVGQDGNAFNLMGLFARQARKEKWTKEEIDSVLHEARTGDYDHLLFVLGQYCEKGDG